MLVIARGPLNSWGDGPQCLVLKMQYQAPQMHPPCLASPGGTHLGALHCSTGTSMPPASLPASWWYHEDPFSQAPAVLCFQVHWCRLSYQQGWILKFYKVDHKELCPQLRTTG